MDYNSVQRQGDSLRLSDIIRDFEYELVKGDLDIEISKIEHDSRKVSEGDMFIAIKGFSVDGHNYVNEAIDKGASCIVVEKEADYDIGKNVTLIKVQDTLLAMAKFSSVFYGEPSKKLNLIGVTGTNGKTSTTYLIKRIFEEDGNKIGVMGTLGVVINGERIENKNTTPESLLIQRQLKRMLDKGMSYCVMEVSSHALDLKRVEYINFQVGIFTNLTEDHLDYHKTMENYYKSKLKLFNMTEKYNVINADDEYGRRMLKDIENKVPVLTYGINEKYHVYATDVNYHTNGVDFILNTPKGSIPIHMKLLGMFNVYNALAAASCAIAYDISLPVIKKGIESVTGIRGRFEVIHVESRDFDVIIDYAHTPDGLEKVLKAIDGFAQGRKIVIFGAGGNRDREKRPIMGEIAANYADICIVTSDNPRYEDPDKIIEDILVGVKRGKAEYVAITDRKDAIKYAIGIAKPKDTILLAGKGHEKYIIIKDKMIPFDEKQIVMDLING